MFADIACWVWVMVGLALGTAVPNSGVASNLYSEQALPRDKKNCLITA